MKLCHPEMVTPGASRPPSLTKPLGLSKPYNYHSLLITLKIQNSIYMRIHIINYRINENYFQAFTKKIQQNMTILCGVYADYLS